MRSKYALLLLMTVLLTVNYISAQQKYPGTIVTKMGKEQTGIITVNLDGSNAELIEIETTETVKSKSKGSRTKQTTTTSTKLNTAIIHHLLIKDSTYYFRDVKYDYNDKYQYNVCVRLIAGTLDCGMFQNGQSTGNANLSVKLPNADFSKLVSTEFDYYKTTMAWHIFAFGRCPSLYKKMEEKLPGYIWDENTTQPNRIMMWKQWIQEYNSCTLEE